MDRGERRCHRAPLSLVVAVVGYQTAWVQRASHFDCVPLAMEEFRSRFCRVYVSRDVGTPSAAVDSRFRRYDVDAGRSQPDRDV